MFDPSFWSRTCGGDMFYTANVVIYLLDGQGDVL
jgi:hypothetical protein